MSALVKIFGCVAKRYCTNFVTVTPSARKHHGSMFDRTGVIADRSFTLRVASIFLAPVTLTLTRWPSYTNPTRSAWRYTAFVIVQIWTVAALPIGLRGSSPVLVTWDTAAKILATPIRKLSQKFRTLHLWLRWTFWPYEKKQNRYQQTLSRAQKLSKLFLRPGVQPGPRRGSSERSPDPKLGRGGSPKLQLTQSNFYK